MPSTTIAEDVVMDQH